SARHAQILLVYLHEPIEQPRSMGAREDREGGYAPADQVRGGLVLLARFQLGTCPVNPGFDAFKEGSRIGRDCRRPGRRVARCAFRTSDELSPDDITSFEVIMRNRHLSKPSHVAWYP